MVAITALVLLSTLATAFYVRFLIAICKESKGQRICHLVRLRFDWDESATRTTVWLRSIPREQPSNARFQPVIPKWGRNI